MIKLKPYQEGAVKAIKDAFKKNTRQYVEMPTGSGKTITFLSYASQFHKKILVIVPSKQLMSQVVNSALLFYEPWEITRKGNGYDDEVNNIEQWEIDKARTYDNVKRIHVCIINSIKGDYVDYLARLCRFDLVVIDEAHHSQAMCYRRYINTACEFVKPPLFLGVTATPDRADGLLLNDILHFCSYKMHISEMIDNGYLSDIEGYAVKTKIGLSDIDDHNGDFSLSQLYKKLSTESRNKMIVEVCKKELKGRKTLVFCINIKHSKEVSELLNKSGVSAAHIDGTMDEKHRNIILQSFRDGEIESLCNCQLLTEGFDEPAIDGIVLARPTRSRSLFTQMLGRGLRLSPGKKNCKVIDVVDNHKALAGFNCLVVDKQYPEPSSFKSFKDLREHVGAEMLKVTEFTIQRTNLLNKKTIDDMYATEDMIEYLTSNQVYFQEPLSFDEGSFLVWYNELKKEYHGKN